MVSFLLGLINIQQKGTIEDLFREFGENLIEFLIGSGFEKMIRVAGRNLREFVLSIDQLHDSNRYRFPRMRSPLFLIDDENENGFKINYRSKIYENIFDQRNFDLLEVRDAAFLHSSTVV